MDRHALDRYITGNWGEDGVQPEPEYIRLAVPDLEGEIHVGHGVSCTLNQTLWYALRPEKLWITRSMI